MPTVSDFSYISCLGQCTCLKGTAIWLNVQNLRDLKLNLTACTILGRTEETGEWVQWFLSSHSLEQRPHPAKPQWDELNQSQTADVWATANDCWGPCVWGSNWYRSTFTWMIKDLFSCPSLSWSWTPAMYQSCSPRAWDASPMRWQSLSNSNWCLIHSLNFKTPPFSEQLEYVCINSTLSPSNGHNSTKLWGIQLKKCTHPVWR